MIWLPWTTFLDWIVIWLLILWSLLCIPKLYSSFYIIYAPSIPGYASKQAEDRKLQVDMKASLSPVSPQCMVAIMSLFHLLWKIRWQNSWGSWCSCLLKTLAEHAVSAGKLPPHSDFDTVSLGMLLVSLWIQRWLSSLSSWRCMFRYLVSYWGCILYKPSGPFRPHLYL